MTNVMPELVTQFHRAHPDVAVEVTFAGSQILRLQIERGAAADVFMSANESHMTALADGGHVARPRRLATTDLVIIVPLDNGAGVERFEDLTRAERIAQEAARFASRPTATETAQPTPRAEAAE